MCDEPTPAELAAAPAVSRRQFALIGTAAVLAACQGTDVSGAGGPAGKAVREAAVMVPTPDGRADALFFHPPSGRHPGVVMWPDIAGIREASRAMARRLAAEGYAVLLVNPYYRGARAPVLASLAEWRTPEGQARLKPLIAAITPEGTTRDGGAFVAWLDSRPEVDKARGIGSNGYCMGGPFAVRTALAAPGRVGAVASLHGGGLVLDATDSPHRLLGQTRASFLFAIGRNDDARSPGDKDALKAAAAAAHRPAEVEVYAADHGWTVPDSPVYNPAEAERAWARMVALFARL
ncbi:dienelactone hydrolase family protein [Novosphingobium bradum]|uniref:Dienelactone hydrolase family protein n=1 Tax=Novosphingobium bradum TaxID=1737444 RepID=A0ABV7IKH6_9SPHN